MTLFYVGRKRICVKECKHYLTFGFQTECLELNAVTEARFLCMMW